MMLKKYEIAVVYLEGVPRVPWNPLSRTSLYQKSLFYLHGIARLSTQDRTACMFVILSTTHLPQ